MGVSRETGGGPGGRQVCGRGGGGVTFSPGVGLTSGLSDPTQVWKRSSQSVSGPTRPGGPVGPASPVRLRAAGPAVSAYAAGPGGPGRPGGPAGTDLLLLVLQWVQLSLTRRVHVVVLSLLITRTPRRWWHQGQNTCLSVLLSDCLPPRPTCRPGPCGPCGSAGPSGWSCCGSSSRSSRSEPGWTWSGRAAWEESRQTGGQVVVCVCFCGVWFWVG